MASQDEVKGLAPERPRRAPCLAASDVVVLVLAVGAAATVAAMGPPPVSSQGYDVLVILNSGWRIHTGQIPHVDYFSPLGPLYPALVAIGMAVRPDAQVLAWVQAGLLLAVAAWSWRVGRARLPPVVQVPTTLFLALLAATPRPLARDIDQWGYSMTYNRLGFALAAVLTLSAALPVARDGTSTWGREDHVSTIFSDASLLALLLLLKLSYFLLMLPLAILLWKWGRLAPRRIVVRLVLAFGLSALGLALLRISPVAFLGDMGLVLTHGAGGMLLKLAQRILPNAEPLFLLGLLALMTQARVTMRGLLRSRPLQVSAAITLAGLVICAANSQYFDVPLLAIAGVVFVELTGCDAPARSRASALHPTLAAGVAPTVAALGLVAQMGLRDVASLVTALRFGHEGREAPLASAREPMTRRFEFVRVDSPAIACLRFPKVKASANSPAEYAAALAEGLRLLGPHVDSRSRVLDMLGTPNPFPLLLGLPSPKHAALFWELGPTRRIVDFIPAAALFDDVSLVLWDRETYDGHAAVPGSFADLYGSYVREHFRPRDASATWILLARR